MNFYRHTGWLLMSAASLAWGFEPKTSLFTNPLKEVRPATQTNNQSSPSSSPVPKPVTPTAISPNMPTLSKRALRGVIINGENSWANVDGDLIRKGGLLDGWRLDRLEPDAAHFSRRGKKQVLELQHPKVQESSSVAVTAQEASGPTATSLSPASPAALPSAIGTGISPQELLQKLIGTPGNIADKPK
ncbi:MAG: hypothetical protein Q8O31_01485 [Rhodocyclaceae bacterium]|nr:hypothetical protein [Rhodocyclaceae bacterium]